MSRFLRRHWLLLGGVLICLPWAGAHSGLTKTDLTVVANDDCDQAQTEMDRLYQLVLSQRDDDAAFCSNLREAQKAYERYIFYQMKVFYPLVEDEDPVTKYGKNYPLDYSNTLLALYRQRIAQLQKLVIPGKTKAPRYPQSHDEESLGD